MDTADYLKSESLRKDKITFVFLMIKDNAMCCEFFTTGGMASKAMYYELLQMQRALDAMIVQQAHDSITKGKSRVKGDMSYVG
jgi:hypothetical protein